MARSLRIPKFRISVPESRSSDEGYEDIFEEMTLAEHLDELRSRIVKMVIGIVVCFVIALILVNPVLRVIRDAANVDQFDVVEATEPITAYFKTALYLAITLALPVIFFQMFSFIAPGLTRKEKRYLYGSLPFVVLFFLMGFSFAFFIAVPRAFEFLSNFNSDLFDYSPTFSSILSFYLQVSIGLGLAFQLPIIMYLTARLGLVSPKRMSQSRRYALVLVLIAAALITPTPDPFNMLFIAAPIYFLYELGIIFAKLAARRSKSHSLRDPEPI